MKKSKVLKILKCFIPKFIIEYRRKKLLSVICENVFQTNYSKNCIIAYITSPFVNGISNSHQGQKVVVNLAEDIKNLGFNVDIVDYNTERTKYTKEYDICIDFALADHPGYENFLKKNCIRIAYLTGSNNSWANRQEQNRIIAANNRKNGKMIPRRQSPNISKCIEKYEGVLFVGNSYNLMTYKKEFSMPPVYYVGNYGVELGVKHNTFNPKSFCFIGSVGQVHKGLDLLLEVFSKYCKDCELYVFSAFNKEMDFCKAYHKELFETSNIHAVGFISLESEEFKQYCEKITYMIIPSCSEGQAGSVASAMGAGLIPICSKECGYEDNEVINLEDCDIETIAKVVNEYSKKDEKWINEHSLKSIELIKTKYSENLQRKRTIDALEKILTITNK